MSNSNFFASLRMLAFRSRFWSMNEGDQRSALLFGLDQKRAFVEEVKQAAKPLVQSALNFSQTWEDQVLHEDPMAATRIAKGFSDLRSIMRNVRGTGNKAIWTALALAEDVAETNSKLSLFIAPPQTILAVSPALPTIQVALELLVRNLEILIQPSLPKMVPSVVAPVCSREASVLAHRLFQVDQFINRLSVSDNEKLEMTDCAPSENFQEPKQEPKIEIYAVTVTTTRTKEGVKVKVERGKVYEPISLRTQQHKSRV